MKESDVIVLKEPKLSLADQFILPQVLIGLGISMKYMLMVLRLKDSRVALFPITFLFVSGLFLARVSPVAAHVTPATQPASFKTLSDATDGFTFDYLDNWASLQPESGSAIRQTFLDSAEGGGSHFWVLVQSGGPNSERAVNRLAEEWIQSNKPNWEVVNNDAATLDGVPARRVHVRSTGDVPSEGFMLVTLNNNKEYLIFYAVKAPSFGTCVTEAEAMLKSFKWTPVPKPATRVQKKIRRVFY